MRLREAINDIKKGVIHPVYLLKGDDHFLQNFFINKLEKEVFNPSDCNNQKEHYRKVQNFQFLCLH